MLYTRIVRFDVMGTIALFFRIWSSTKHGLKRYTAEGLMLVGFVAPQAHARASSRWAWGVGAWRMQVVASGVGRAQLAVSH